MDKYNVSFAEDHSGYTVEDVEAQVGRPAPTLTLETVDRAPVSLADYHGRAHVVLVFGSIT
jgi:peroxiredoxin